MRTRKNRRAYKEREKFECDRSGFTGRQGDFVTDRGKSVLRTRKMKDETSDLDKDWR